MCMICHDNKKETRYISLFVTGSEGLTICHDCEMKIVEFVRSLISEELQNRKKEFFNKHFK